MQTTQLSSLEFDSELVSRYDGHGPRYTSYPTADRFNAGSYSADLIQSIRDRHGVGNRKAISLYVHIPFCDTVCYYCACNKIVTKHRDRADAYLDDLEKEMVLVTGHFGQKPLVCQLHFGGGTPTFLTNDQMHRLLAMLKRYFDFTDHAECSIEIDPRSLQDGALEILRHFGFNRMSIGVQDIDEEVQKAINRIQPVECTQSALTKARDLGFKSVNMDLIYGLPKQSVQTLARTLNTVLAWRPDRIALYNYAHLPERFKPQRRIDPAQMPAPAEKLAMLKLAVTTLLDAGYVYIGMDHFALPDDDLSRALEDGTLQRNFQGYSTCADCDLVALGISAISKVGGVYAQNARTAQEYSEMLAKGELPIIRGFVMNRDDAIRRDAIHDLLCESELDLEEFGRRWSIDPFDYFAQELESMGSLQADGLVQLQDDRIVITPKGRFLARVVAMKFDWYLRNASSTVRFSKVI